MLGAGIPDFRSPGTGLYDNLQKYGLPYPEAIFEVNYYRKKPEPFISLAHELWPGIQYKPTLTHHFLKLLADKNLLLRIYSQNIDGLEFLAGIPEDKLVECHGHFRTASCIDCKRTADPEKVRETIVKDGKTPNCEYCGGNVKPDIVFFGEQLPDRFHKLLKQDIPKADLLLVMGTSLNVAPVSHIPNMVRCNRVLFNRDLVMRLRRHKDTFVEGDCDTNVQKLMNRLNWSIATPQEQFQKKEEKKEASKEKKESKKDDDDDDDDDDEEKDLEKLFSKIEIKDDGDNQTKSKKGEKDKE